MGDDWDKQLDDGAASIQVRAHLEAVTALPGFADAARRAASAERYRRADDPILFKASHDVGRYLIWAFAAYLNTAPEGVTHTSLTRALEEAGVASRGRARVMLLFLLAIGFVTPMPRSNDGRERRYALTPVMEASIVSHYRRILTAAAPVMPASAQALTLLDDPEFLRLYGAAHGQLILKTVRTMTREEGPSLDIFTRRAGGLHVLTWIITVGEADDVFPPARPLLLSVSAIARDCEISRIQVRRILKDAEAQGFLATDEDGRVLVTFLLAQHVLWWTAIRFQATEAASQAALGRWSAVKRKRPDVSARPPTSAMALGA